MSPGDWRGGRRTLGCQGTERNIIGIPTYPSFPGSLLRLRTWSSTVQGPLHSRGYWEHDGVGRRSIQTRPGGGGGGGGGGGSVAKSCPRWRINVGKLLVFCTLGPGDSPEAPGHDLHPHPVPPSEATSTLKDPFAHIGPAVVRGWGKDEELSRLGEVPSGFRGSRNPYGVSLLTGSQGASWDPELDPLYPRCLRLNTVPVPHHHTGPFGQRS